MARRTYGMTVQVRSEKMKEAVKVLRREIGFARRARARLESGYIPKRRRTTKGSKSGIAASTSDSEVGGHGDREDRTPDLRPSET